MQRRPLVLKNGKVNVLPVGDSIEGQQNFSVVTINEGETVVVPAGQEMVHRRDLMVRGNLMVYGDTYQIPDTAATVVESPFFWTTITETENVTVPENRLLLYVSPLMVRGNLMVSGLLKGV